MVPNVRHTCRTLHPRETVYTLEVYTLWRLCMVRAFDLLACLPEDVVNVERENDQPQKRKGL